MGDSLDDSIVSGSFWTFHLLLLPPSLDRWRSLAWPDSVFPPPPRPRARIPSSSPWRQASSPGSSCLVFLPCHRPGCLDHFQMVQDRGQKSHRWVCAKLLQPPHLGLILSSPSPISEWQLGPGTLPACRRSAVPSLWLLSPLA